MRKLIFILLLGFMFNFAFCGEAKTITPNCGADQIEVIDEKGNSTCEIKKGEKKKTK